MSFAKELQDSREGGGGGGLADCIGVRVNRLAEGCRDGTPESGGYADAGRMVALIYGALMMLEG